MQVSKYDIRWQFFRVSLKGKSFQDKKNLIISFLPYLSFNNKERLRNYIEGCFLSPENESELLSLIEKSPTISSVSSVSFEDYSVEERVLLYRDLFIRNKNWLSKGYLHKEQNEFIDNLSLYVPIKYQKSEELISLREKCSKMKNTWKFIY